MLVCRLIKALFVLYLGGHGAPIWTKTGNVLPLHHPCYDHRLPYSPPPPPPCTLLMAPSPSNPPPPITTEDPCLLSVPRVGRNQYQFWGLHCGVKSK